MTAKTWDTPLETVKEYEAIKAVADNALALRRLFRRHHRGIRTLAMSGDLSIHLLRPRLEAGGQSDGTHIHVEVLAIRGKLLASWPKEDALLGRHAGLGEWTCQIVFEGRAHRLICSERDWRAWMNRRDRLVLSESRRRAEMAQAMSRENPRNPEIASMPPRPPRPKPLLDDPRPRSKSCGRSGTPLIVWRMGEPHLKRKCKNQLVFLRGLCGLNLSSTQKTRLRTAIRQGTPFNGWHVEVHDERREP